MLTRQQRAKVLMLDSEGRLLLVQNTLGDRCWTLPGGGVERGESVLEAAVREVHEELGVVLEATMCRQIGLVRVVKGGYDAPIVVVRLSKAQKASVQPRKLEIYAAEWHDATQLPSETQPIVSEAQALLSVEASIATIV